MFLSRKVSLWTLKYVHAGVMTIIKVHHHQILPECIHKIVIFFFMAKSLKLWFLIHILAMGRKC